MERWVGQASDDPLIARNAFLVVRQKYDLQVSYETFKRLARDHRLGERPRRQIIRVEPPPVAGAGLVKIAPQPVESTQMENLTFSNPTKIIFGRGTENQVGTETRRHAGNVLLHYGTRSIKRSGLYDRVVSSLEQAGVPFIELGAHGPTRGTTVAVTPRRVARERNSSGRTARYRGLSGGGQGTPCGRPGS